MNGTTHAAVGAASMVGAALVGVPLADMVPMAAISAGAALGPDIDHPNSTVTQSYGRAHEVIHALSRQVRLATATVYDRRGWHGNRYDPDHRALTHTGLSAVVVGAACGAVSLAPGGAVLLAALWTWPLRKMIRYGMALPFLCSLWVLIARLDPSMMMWAVGVGWFSHVLADGCTTAGVPLLWPLSIKGKRWWRVRLLGGALTSGHQYEWIAGAGCAAILCVVPVLFLG